MQRIFRLGLLAALVAGFASCSHTSQYPNRAEAIRASLLDPDSKQVLVASHRADWRNYPENSMEGIESAIRMGVDIVELDLQCTADSQLIIMHDSRLDRTTTGKGRISEITLDSVRNVRLKNGVSIRTRYHVPTLREVLVACQGRVLINLDKADRYFDLVVPLLEETGTTRQIIMKGRKPADEVRALYGRYLDDVIYMPIVDMNDSASVTLVEQHLQSAPCAFELCYRDDDRYMQQAHALLQGKSRIWVNCLWDTLCGGHEDDQAIINPDDHYGYLIHTLGATILQTDRPEFLIHYLQQHNLR